MWDRALLGHSHSNGWLGNTGCLGLYAKFVVPSQDVDLYAHAAQDLRMGMGMDDNTDNIILNLSVLSPI